MTTPMAIGDTSARRAAQNLLSTQLGRDDIRFVEKEYDLEGRGV